MSDFMIKLCAGLMAAFILIRLIIPRLNKEKPGISPAGVKTLPPEGVYPCEIGYILRRCTVNHDIASIFVGWMCSGAVTLEQGGGLSNTYIIKNRPDVGAPRYQTLIYNEIFRHADRIPLSKLTSVYPGLVKDTKKRIIVKYDEKHTRVFSVPAAVLQDAVLCASAFPLALLFGYGINEYLNTLWLSALIGAGVFFALYYTGVLFCRTAMFKKAAALEEYKPLKNEYKTLEKRARRQMSITAVIVFAAVIAACILYFKDGIASVVASATAAVGLCTAPALERRSEKGAVLAAELNSLKNYMKNYSAFKEKTEFRFRSEHDYFNMLLPYAYALGVSENWLNAEVFADKQTLSLSQAIREKVFTVMFIELTSMFVEALCVKPNQNAAL